MKSLAIICEYNPFHKGHEKLISAVKEKFPDSPVISVMSGNTVQRGGFSIYGKYYRAKCAVLGGSDIVAELPFPYSSSAGEQFARAGVHIAAKLGAEYLAFGSESGALEHLKVHAKNLLRPEFEKKLGDMSKLSRDISFIRLREVLYKEMFGMALPIGGNDILGIEYIKAIISGGYNITPVTVKRVEGYSATQSREALYKGSFDEINRLISSDFVSDKLHSGLNGIGSLILGALRLGKFSDNGSGIANALASCAKRTNDFEKFLSDIPTSTYTSARLRRELIDILFGVTNEMKNRLPEFTVLLGASRLGTEYLGKRRKNSDFPILTKNSDISSYPDIDKNMIELCKTVDSVYSLASGEPRVAQYFEKPFIFDGERGK